MATERPESKTAGNRRSAWLARVFRAAWLSIGLCAASAPLAAQQATSGTVVDTVSRRPLGLPKLTPEERALLGLPRSSQIVNQTVQDLVSLEIQRLDKLLSETGVRVFRPSRLNAPVISSIPLISGVAAALTAIFGPGEIEEVGGPADPSGLVLDVTDPAVDPGILSRELAPGEKLLRAMRRLTAGLEAAFTESPPLQIPLTDVQLPVVIPTGSGIEMAKQKGELSEPANTLEAAIDYFAPILGQLAIFTGAGLLGGLIGGAAGAVAGGDGAAARLAAAVRTNVPQLLGRALPKSLAEKIAARTGTGSLKFLGRLGPEEVRRYLGALAEDVLVGAGLGAAVVSGYEQLMETFLGEQKEPIEQLLFLTGLSAGLGAAVGMAFRPSTSVNVARAVWNLRRAVDETTDPLPIGTIIGDKVKTTVGKGSNSRVVWMNQKTGQIDVPSVEEINDYIKFSIVEPHPVGVLVPTVEEINNYIKSTTETVRKAAETADAVKIQRAAE